MPDFSDCLFCMDTTQVVCLFLLGDLHTNSCGILALKKAIRFGAQAMVALKLGCKVIERHAKDTETHHSHITGLSLVWETSVK